MRLIAHTSLLNQASLERTLGWPAILTRLDIPGFQRVFNAPVGQYAYGNLQPQAGSLVQAACFELPDTALGSLRDREIGYQLVEILPDHWAFIRPPQTCQALPVLRSYIRVAEQGAAALGLDFWSGTQYPAHIIEDLESPRYH